MPSLLRGLRAACKSSSASTTHLHVRAKIGRDDAFIEAARAHATSTVENNDDVFAINVSRSGEEVDAFCIELLHRPDAMLSGARLEWWSVLEATIDDAPRSATWDSIFIVEKAEEAHSEEPEDAAAAGEWLSFARRARRLKGGVRTS